MNPAELIERALVAVREAGADEAAVLVRADAIANIRWANNTMTTNGISDDLSFFVVAIVAGAAGGASGSARDAGDLQAVTVVAGRAVAAARAAAGAGAAADAMPLPGPEAGADNGPDFDTPAAEVDFALFRGLIDGLGEAFGEAREADCVLYGFARSEAATTWLGTSTGVRRRWVQPGGMWELNAKSADLVRSAWAGNSTTDFGEVDLPARWRDLHTRLGWAGRSVALPAGRYDTVLPPSAVADFMVVLGWRSALRPAGEGRSAFAAPGGGLRIGERLTDLPLTLACDSAAAGLRTSPFVATSDSSDLESVFDNGAPIGRTELISAGVISELGSTRAAAREFGRPFAPLADNLLLSGGPAARTEADLIAGVDHGLLVTSQWYLREVDPATMLTTGLTRDGVFFIERGEVTAAVNNFRFNMSPLDVLRQATDVGQTVRALSREWSDWFTRSAMPPLRVADFNMSSVSQAT